MQNTSINRERVLLFGALGLLLIPLLRRLTRARLQGEVALVTGGSRGLGLSIARELAKAGCRLAICARDEDELEAARADLHERGAEVLALTCDVRDRSQVAETLARVTRHYGRIDILVNNAGIIQVGPAEHMTHERFREALDTDFWGVVNTTLAALPQMTARGSGRIVNITSIGGRVPIAHMLPYVTAKFAATGFSEGLRTELKHRGIYVTTVLPTTLRTGAHLQAQFTGDPAQEYSWFAPSASLPFLSVSAEKAGRQVVRALRRRRAVQYVGWQARLLGTLHGLLPGAFVDFLSLSNRYALPDAVAETAPVAAEVQRGMEVAEELSGPRRRLLRPLTFLGRRAAREFNQYAGE